MMFFKKKRKAAPQQHPLLESNWGGSRDVALPAHLCPFVVAGEGSMCYPTTRIFNLLGRREAISVGKNTFIRGELTTFAHGGNIRIGDHCYIGEGTRIWSAKSIAIGDRVLISHNVNVYDNDTHPIDDPVARHEQFRAIITTGHPTSIDLNEKSVIINDDALLASQCIILKGVTIGKAAVVAAGAVVTKDVPAYTLVAGNPARIIRRLEQTHG